YLGTLLVEGHAGGVGGNAGPGGGRRVVVAARVEGTEQFRPALDAEPVVRVADVRAGRRQTLALPPAAGARLPVVRSVTRSAAAGAGVLGVQGAAAIGDFQGDEGAAQRGIGAQVARGEQAVAGRAARRGLVGLAQSRRWRGGVRDACGTGTINGACGTADIFTLRHAWITPPIPSPMAGPARAGDGRRRRG